MTTRPSLRTDRSVAAGVLAVVLFALMALIVVSTAFGEMAGFPEGTVITKEIGYAMFDYGALQSTEGAIADTEPFLAAFLLIAVVLDAALDASLVLAKREEAGETVAALASASADSDTGLARSGTGADPAAESGPGEPTADGGTTDAGASHADEPAEDSDADADSGGERQ